MLSPRISSLLFRDSSVHSVSFLCSWSFLSPFLTKIQSFIFPSPDKFFLTILSSSRLNLCFLFILLSVHPLCSCFVSLFSPKVFSFQLCPFVLNVVSNPCPSLLSLKTGSCWLRVEKVFHLLWYSRVLVWKWKETRFSLYQLCSKELVTTCYGLEQPKQFCVERSFGIMLKIQRLLVVYPKKEMGKSLILKIGFMKIRLFLPYSMDI